MVGQQAQDDKEENEAWGWERPRMHLACSSEEFPGHLRVRVSPHVSGGRPIEVGGRGVRNLSRPVRQVCVLCVRS